MKDIVRFILERLLTKTFWMFVVTTFLGILMYDARSSFKDKIFQDAVMDQRKHGWNSWNPTTPFDR